MSGLVIFDCDGVLIDSEVMACRVMAEVLSDAGFPVLEAEMRAFVGMSGPAAYEIIAERFGRAVPEETRAAVRGRFRTHLECGLAPIAGVAEIIDALAVPYCVASNSSHAYLESALRGAGLAERFAGRVFSAADVARPKPQPDLFLHAAQTMGVAPARCIVVEDSVHGVAAGAAAGMRVVGFLGGGHCAPEDETRLRAAGAESVVGAMADLARLLDGDGLLERRRA